MAAISLSLPQALLRSYALANDMLSISLCRGVVHEAGAIHAFVIELDPPRFIPFVPQERAHTRA